MTAAARRSLLLLTAAGLAGCGGGDGPAAKITGECAAGKTLTFASVHAATLKAALGAGAYRRAGLVFPGKQSTVPDSGRCTYKRGKAHELTVALNRKTPFFTSVGEARRLKDNALAAPIAGLPDGYAFEEAAPGRRSAWAVALDPRGRITWAHVSSPPSSRDATGAAITALRQAVTAFDAPMKEKP